MFIERDPKQTKTQRGIAGRAQFLSFNFPNALICEAASSARIIIQS
jgi:hypothetical protein